jgi:hypothetical protein
LLQLPEHRAHEPPPSLQPLLPQLLTDLASRLVEVLVTFRIFMVTLLSV